MRRAAPILPLEFLPLPIPPFAEWQRVGRERDETALGQFDGGHVHEFLAKKTSRHVTVQDEHGGRPGCESLGDAKKRVHRLSLDRARITDVKTAVEWVVVLFVGTKTIFQHLTAVMV